MDIGVISVRYARALLKGATSAKVEDQVYEDVLTLVESYVNVTDLRFTIDNPILAKDVKQNLLETACGSKPADLTKHFLQLVLSEDREHVLQFIATSYIRLYRVQKNIISGKFTTAIPSNPETIDKMKVAIEKRTNSIVDFQTTVDADIIGGFILEYDTYRMDASVKAKLNEVITQLNK